MPCHITLPAPAAVARARPSPQSRKSGPHLSEAPRGLLTAAAAAAGPRRRLGHGAPPGWADQAALRGSWCRRRTDKAGLGSREGSGWVSRPGAAPAAAHSR
eukprot:scaffold66439_cov67-Phaeocystis_antarctica.AAC.4